MVRPDEVPQEARNGDYDLGVRPNDIVFDDTSPLKAKVEVIRITENHPEGLNQISFQREEERILSVERTVFVESNLEQSIEKELFVSYDIHGAPFPANIVIERMQGTRTYSYSKKSKDTQPLKELLLVLLKTIAETW